MTSSRHNGGAATPAGGTAYHGTILASIVELREAQLSLARPVGDEPLAAALRSLEAGGPNGAELRTIGLLGNHTGHRAKTLAFIDQYIRINDDTIKLLPFQAHTTYVVSGSTLKGRSKKSKAGYHGPDLATVDKLKAGGASNVAWNIEAGVERILRALGDYTNRASHSTGVGWIRLGRGWLHRDERPRGRAGVRFSGASRRGCGLGIILERKLIVRLEGISP